MQRCWVLTWVLTHAACKHVARGSFCIPEPTLGLYGHTRQPPRGLGTATSAHALVHIWVGHSLSFGPGALPKLACVQVAAFMHLQWWLSAVHAVVYWTAYIPLHFIRKRARPKERPIGLEAELTCA